MPKEKPPEAIAQIDKFRNAARDIEADDSEEAFDRILKKIAKASPTKEAKKN